MKSILFEIGRLTATNSTAIIWETNRSSEFFVAYLKSKSNVEHVEKKMSLIGYVFSKLETAKDVAS